MVVVNDQQMIDTASSSGKPRARSMYSIHKDVLKYLIIQYRRGDEDCCQVDRKQQQQT